MVMRFGSGWCWSRYGGTDGTGMGLLLDTVLTVPQMLTCYSIASQKVALSGGGSSDLMGGP